MIKKIIIFLFFLSILFVSSPVFSESWVNLLCGNDETVIFSAVPTSDGNIVYTGAIGSLYSLFVFKTDYYGKILWQKKIGIQATFLGVKIIETSDDNYFVSGDYSVTGNNDDYDIFLAKLDKDGNLLWEKTYGGSKEDALASMLQDGDGNIVLLCYSLSFSNGSAGKMCLIKLDPDGDMIWAKMFSMAKDNYDFVGFNLENANDGGYVITGNSYYNNKYAIFLTKVDRDGRVEWVKIYNFKDENMSDEIDSFSLVPTGDGYMLTGYIRNDTLLLKVDNSGNILWQKNIGACNSYESIGISIQKTEDNNYVLLGDTEGFDSADDISLFKLDKSGNILWSKVYGGDFEYFFLVYKLALQSMTCLKDGSFLLYPIFYNGFYCVDNYTPDTLIKTDVNGNVPGCILYKDVDVTFCEDSELNLKSVTASASVVDINLTIQNQNFPERDASVTLDKICGNSPKWAKKYGGMYSQIGFLVKQVWNGGFVTVSKHSYSDEDSDSIISLLSPDGDVIWENGYGGIKMDELTGIYPYVFGDNHYLIFTGYTSSFNASDYDGWLVMVNFLDGSIISQKRFSGVGYEIITSMCDSSYGYKMLEGITTSNTISNSTDIWIAEVDQINDFKIDWKKSYGSSNGGNEACGNILPTSDNGYVAFGFTDSVAGKNEDNLVFKLDRDGNILWQKAFGGDNEDELVGGVETDDGGFIVLGNTNSFGAGGSNIMVSKIDSSGNLIWSKIYGGSGDDVAFSIIQDGEGNFMISGYTNSFGNGGYDGLIFKIDGSGNILTERVFGTQNNDFIYDIEKCYDGRYIAIGATAGSSISGGNMLLLKINSLCDLPDCLLVGNSNLEVSDVNPTSEDLDLVVGNPSIIESTTNCYPNEITSPYSSEVCSPYSSEYDLNSDGSVDIKDVILLENYLSENLSDAQIDFENADINGDGVIDVNDLTLLLVRIVSK